MRASIIDLRKQNLLTKDNVTVEIDCFCQYKILYPELAVFKVANPVEMIYFMVQGTLKSIIAEHTLSEILVCRKEIEAKLTDIIDDAVDQYGIKVINIGTQEMSLPKSMERAMAIVAETDKQKEAKLINAQANVESAKLFKDAADELSQNPVSLQL